MSWDKAGGVATGPANKGLMENPKPKPVSKQCEALDG